MNICSLNQQRVLTLSVTVILLMLLMVPEPVSSLTRESLRSHGHLFSYSIQPSWKSGPIQDDEFRLIFSFFNESEDPFYLRSIEMFKPEDLYVQRRSWDDTPRMRPRGENVTAADSRVAVNYNETLRGFVEGKPLKGRIIYANMAVDEDRAVTEPLEVNVHWSRTKESDTRTIKLKKPLEINTSENQ